MLLSKQDRIRLARPMPNSFAAVLRKLGLVSLPTAVPIAGMANSRPALLCFQHSRAGVRCLGVPVKGLFVLCLLGTQLGLTFGFEPQHPSPQCGGEGLLGQRGVQAAQWSAATTAEISAAHLQTQTAS